MNIKEVSDGLLLEDQQGNCVGKLSGYLDDDYYIITKIEGDNNAKSFFDYLRDTFPNVYLTIVSWKEDLAYEEILRSFGYDMSFEKICYHRSIIDYRTPYDDPFEYSPLLELNIDIFKQLFNQVRIGDIDLKFSVEEAMRRTFGDLNGPYVSNWKVASLNGQFVGLIMPEIFPDTQMGTVAYMGIIPTFRGKGYGKILHTRALEEIRKLNATNYQGATSVDNNYMKKVFETNGCSLRGIRRYWHKNCR